METTQQEVHLTRAAFLYALDAVHGSAVIGMESSALLPQDPDQCEQRLREGEAELLQNGLLLVGNNHLRVLDITLAAMITTLAYPDLAAIAVRNVTHIGPQLFLLYQSGEMVVEQTFPEEGIHRLALLAEPAAMISRLHEVLPIPPSEAPVQHFELEQSAFLELTRLAEIHEHQAGEAMLFRSGVHSLGGTDLLRALEHPQLRGNVALLRCMGSTITDARNIALVQDARATWTIYQRIPGEQLLEVATTSSTEIERWLTHACNDLRAA